MLIAGCTSSGSTNEKSISLGGYNFTADLPDGWKTFENIAVHEVNEGDENSYSANIDDGYSWKGFTVEPWFYPQYPNAPKDDDTYGSFSSVVNLYVLTIPADLKKDQLEENIRIYGSEDKIPDEQKEKDIAKILTDAAPPYLSDLLKDYNDEDLTFNDLPAHLAEKEAYRNDNFDETNSYGRMAVLLDENTVGIIDVYVQRYSPSGQFFDGDARDIIDSITIAKE